MIAVTIEETVSVSQSGARNLIRSRKPCPTIQMRPPTEKAMTSVLNTLDLGSFFLTYSMYT